MDPFIHYGIAASMMAIAGCGLEIDERDAERIGVAIGAGIGGIHGIEETTIKYHEGGPRKISPFYVPSTIINMIAGPAVDHDRRSRARTSPRSPPAPPPPTTSAWRCA